MLLLSPFLYALTNKKTRLTFLGTDVGIAVMQSIRNDTEPNKFGDVLFEWNGLQSAAVALLLPGY